MTDTKTSQNIDLSSWDTCINKLRYPAHAYKQCIEESNFVFSRQEYHHCSFIIVQVQDNAFVRDRERTEEGNKR
jgi:hypothetical protein